MVSRSLALLSTENLQHNVAVIRERVGSAKIIAMIKANAYGHGIRSVALRLAGSVDFFGVASLEEAFILEDCGIKTPIILMQGLFSKEDFFLAIKKSFHIVVHQQKHLEWLGNITHKDAINLWLKVDTGLGRLGFSMVEAEKAYRVLSEHSAVQKPLPILSHMACADHKEHPLNALQIAAFQDYIADKEGAFSLANSGTIFHFPECSYDYVRPGLALYGASPCRNDSVELLGLKPVMTVQSVVMAIYAFHKGESIGYGARFTCLEDMRVAIVAFGYGDGYPAQARDGAPTMIRGQECPLVGAVSMDMMAVDLKNAPTAEVGDPVILWGEALPVERLLPYTNNSAWNILTGVQNRVKFIWSDPV
jgi:alanine racemase